jgi:hypothetical protein
MIFTSFAKTRSVASPSAAATFGCVADVRALSGGDLFGSPTWGPPV